MDNGIFLFQLRFAIFFKTILIIIRSIITCPPIFINFTSKGFT
jgi:hypothetical protein